MHPVSGRTTSPSSAAAIPRETFNTTPHITSESKSILGSGAPSTTGDSSKHDASGPHPLWRSPRDVVRASASRGAGPGRWLGRRGMQYLGARGKDSPSSRPGRGVDGSSRRLFAPGPRQLTRPIKPSQKASIRLSKSPGVLGAGRTGPLASASGAFERGSLRPRSQAFPILPPGHAPFTP